MNKHIVAIFSHDGEKTSIGTAFLIGNKLITAGHVIKANAIRNSIILNGALRVLPSPDFSPLLRDGHFDIPDLAVFTLTDINSPLNFSSRIVEVGMQLKGCCYQATENEITPVEYTFKVSDVDYDYQLYFAGTPSKIILPTSSGSPVFNGENEIIGMLVAGPDPKEINGTLMKKCAFLSAHKILEFV